MKHTCLKHLNFIGSVITYVRNFVLNVIFLLFVLFIVTGILISAAVSTKGNEELAANVDKSLLYINFNGEIRDAPLVITPLDELIRQLENEGDESKYFLEQYLEVIRTATEDKNVKYLVMNLSKLTNLRPDLIANLGEELTKFKQAGKKIYAFAMSYSQQNYALASYADYIYLDPMGGIEINGYALTSVYFKDLLDTAKITVYTPKVGTHKSAVEPYNRNDMSAWVKEEYTHITDNLWGEYTSLITKNRPKVVLDKMLFASDEYLNELTEYQGDNAQMAKELGFVDFVGTYQDAIDDISKKTKVKVITHKNNRDIAAMQFEDYLIKAKPTPKSANKIAVLYGIGAITSESEDLNAFSSNNIVPQLRKLANRRNVKAVVLYLNTPGGEVFASEIMRREISYLRSKGKKVVVYMSSMAASGGYYVSTAADAIIATPTTLTGSIGVYGMMFSAERLSNSFGIYADGVKTNKDTHTTFFEPISPNAMQAVQLEIDNTYHDFISLVANARKISLEEADRIAQGQVYTAKDALAIKLVDKIGNFKDALAEAAKLAKIKDYDLELSTPDITGADMGVMSILTGKVIAAYDKGLAINYLKSVEEELPIPLKQTLKAQDIKKKMVYSITEVRPAY